MKLLANKCVCGRLGDAKEIQAHARLEQMARETIARATTAEPPFAAGPYYDVAEIHEFDLGVARDMDAALHWYQRAADQGHHAAKLRLNDLCPSKRTP